MVFLGPWHLSLFIDYRYQRCSALEIEIDEFRIALWQEQTLSVHWQAASLIINDGCSYMPALLPNPVHSLLLPEQLGNFKLNLVMKAVQDDSQALPTLRACLDLCIKLCTG